VAIVSLYIGTDFTVSNILLALEEVTEPYLLGIHLGIEPHHLKRFEREHHDTERRKIEVIRYWLLNNEECSWETLADAVKRMDHHGNVVDSIRIL
jgi:hypothetical protein